MNRGVMILIIVVTVVIFAGLSIWGWQNRYGGPLPPTDPVFQELTMPKLVNELTLVEADLELGELAEQLAPASRTVSPGEDAPEYARLLEEYSEPFGDG